MYSVRLFLIKQTQYTVRSLLKDEKLAKRYEGGTAYIIRLTVDDYHRYCYVADGVKSAQRKIRGVFHTVNPVANDYAPIYKMKEVIQMFSEELLELDRNTVEFMIEDMRRQIEEKDEQIKQLDEQIKQKDEQLRQLDEQIKVSEQEIQKMEEA